MSGITQEVLELFNEINKVPRCSKNESGISDWLVNWAAKNGFSTKRDEALNVVIEVPASPGFEKKPIVILQGHMDMVCEKTPDSGHDFSKDPIESYIDGEWLKAKGTTLGADDGIALAIALTIAKKMKHPPLELLFTVDEETGLTGATSLDPQMLKGKILMNIDSEDEGVFTIGCAGGRDSKIELSLKLEKTRIEKAYKVRISGLQGGHSGIDIDKPKANANILLARLLKEMFENTKLGIIDIKGGSAHNAIPRNAEAIVTVEDPEKCLKIVEDFEKIFKNEHGEYEPTLKCTFEEVEETYERMVSIEATKKLIELMLAMPHGVLSYSKEIKGLVETSNNFATVEIQNEKLRISSSQRSSKLSKLDFITKKIEAVAILAGAEVKSGKGYPAWEPNFESNLLKQSLKVYKDTFGTEAKVEVIHAGLECGIIGSKYEDMEMISLGPTVKYPHSPKEKLFIPSIEKLWKFFEKFFEAL